MSVSKDSPYRDYAKEHLKEYISQTKFSDPPKWDFAIYRTAYGPGTDEAWESLTDAICDNIWDGICKHEGYQKSPDSDDELTRLCEEFLALFILDDKEDRSTLEGASMERVREIINQTEPPVFEDVHEVTMIDPTGKQTTYKNGYIVPTLIRRNMVFLYADEEVLGTMETKTPWVKAVDLEYDPVAAKGNGRMPQSYYGYMKLTVWSVYELWRELEIFRYLSRVAPADEDEGKLKVWDGPK